MSTGREYWDGLAELWRDARPTPLWRRHSDAVNAGLVERWLPSHVGRVLKTDLFDEGVSDGLFTVLAERSDEVVGIDVSGEIVRAALARHPGLVGQEADVRQLPFQAESFDAVVSNSTLDHFDDAGPILASLRELHRVLRPHGRLILTLDNPWNPINALAKALPRAWLNRIWIRYARVTARVGHVPYHVGETMSARRLRRALPSVGFDVVDEAAVMHAPRALAVIVAELLERRAGPASQRRFLRALAGLERLSSLPTRNLTAHFVAVHAVKRG